MEGVLILTLAFCAVYLLVWLVGWVRWNVVCCGLESDNFLDLDCVVRASVCVMDASFGNVMHMI